MAQSNEAQERYEETPKMDAGNPVRLPDTVDDLDTRQPRTSRNNPSLGGSRDGLAEKVSDSATVRQVSKAASLRTGGAKGKRATKTVSTKAEADWLKRNFPSLIEGQAGRWDVRPDCAGFGVYFRVDKRQNNGEPINLKFPRISREMFLTLKGMSDDERTSKIANYVGSHLSDAIGKGIDRARIVAGKLRASS